MLTDGGVLIAFAVGSVLVSLGTPGLGDRIDPIVALVMACYMLWVGVDLVRHNFRALMDLPLPEEDQLTITRVLATHYADYDSVGTLFTRASGNRRIVEVELGFDGERTVDHVHTLSRHMERDLTSEVPGLRFRIVPVWGPEETRAEPGGDEAIEQAPAESRQPTSGPAGASRRPARRVVRARSGRRLLRSAAGGPLCSRTSTSRCTPNDTYVLLDVRPGVPAPRANTRAALRRVAARRG